MPLIDSTTFDKTRSETQSRVYYFLLYKKTVSRTVEVFEWVTDGSSAGITKQNPNARDSTWQYTGAHSVGYGELEGRWTETYESSSATIEGYS